MADDVKPAATLTARRAISKARGILLGLAVFSLFVNLLALTGPLYMLQVYDRVLISASIPTLLGLTALIVVLYLTLGLLDWCRASIFSIVASSFEERLTGRAVEAAFVQNRALPARTTDRPLRDLRTLRRFISSPALAAMFDLPFTPIFFAVLFMMHAYYGLWALAGAAILVTLALVNQFVNRRALREADLREAEANRSAAELLRQSETIDALGMRRRMVSLWREQYEDSDRALTKSGKRLGGFTAATKGFRLLLQSGILGLGAWLSIEQQSTPGAMIAASIILGRAIAPLEQIVGQWRNIVAGRAAWDGLQSALNDLPQDKPRTALPPLRGDVEFREVAAAAPGVRTPFLRDVSLRIDAGECVGVIGPSASGKSTFARVLIGLWTPLFGKVRIDGADLSQIPRERLGLQIGYMPQHVDLFAGTVAQNIARFELEPADGDVLEAAQAAGCHDMILNLPDGYETEIGEGGQFLSSGQRQRLGLARALYGKPALVVLDEPNANLDGVGDAALQTAIKDLKDRGATVVIIAHRPNAIAHCNKILVMDQGRVSLYGDRDDVLGELNRRVSSAQVTAIRGDG